MVTDTLLAAHPIISDQVERAELRVVLLELEKQLESGTVGNIVEFGCYAGTTSLFVRRLLDTYHSAAEYHVYDSFVGLPDKTRHDQSAAGDQFVTGELAVSKKDFLMNFKKAGLKPPFIHKGWFADVAPSDVPNNISFAFFDGDYYESIRDSFVCVEHKLMPRATIIVDDYANEALPGAAVATDQWLAAHPATHRVQASLAIIRL